MLAPKTLLQNRYEIVRQIGQGGMGAVYEAIDHRLHATVALKETLFSDASMQRAFEREAKLLARLRHPVLPKVFDYFFDGNGQFLVMEFVGGDDLATRMEKSGGKFPLNKVVPWVLRWADQLLNALEYLHSQDPPAIHRDIKPQNLKLTPRGEIVLLDFGLARGGLADVSTITARGNIEGYTPNYAPLEQIRGSEPEARSDLYSLAATLYHVLVGEKPPDALTRAASLLNNQSDPLTLANEVNPHVPPYVASVLHKAMSLNPDSRPVSATEMRRALQHRTTQVLGSSDSPVVTQELHVSAQNIQITGPAANSLNSAQSQATQRLSSDEPPGTLLRTITTASPILSVAFSPDGQTAAVAGEDAVISIWQLSTGNLLKSFEGHAGSVRSIAFSPDGQLLVSGSEDKTVRLWWVKDGTEAFHTDLDAVESVTFSPDGKLVAAGGWSGAVAVYEVRDDDIEEVQSLSASIVHCVAFSPDGKTLAAGCYDTTIIMWWVSDGHQIQMLEGHTNFVFAVAFSPDGQTLASGGGGSGLRIWRVSDGRQLDMLTGHTNFIHGLAYSSDGMHLASASADETVRIWRTGDGASLYTLDQHGDGVTSVAFSPDGHTLISGCRDQKLRLWQVKGSE